MWSGKQPIRTRYSGHVTGYQPIRDQYFLMLNLPTPQLGFEKFLVKKVLTKAFLKKTRVSEHLEREYSDPSRPFGVRPSSLREAATRPHVAAPGLRPGAKRRVLYETNIELEFKIQANQSSLFRSRDWLSANQGPVSFLIRPVTGGYVIVVCFSLEGLHLKTNQNSLFRSRDWSQPIRDQSCHVLPIFQHTVKAGLRPGAKRRVLYETNIELEFKIQANQSSLFRSRDWLSANQGPVSFLIRPVTGGYVIVVCFSLEGLHFNLTETSKNQSELFI
eukprot:sb/3468052/